jgi:hypothetical protein
MCIGNVAEIWIGMTGNSIFRKIEGDSTLCIELLANALAHEMKKSAKPGVSDEENVQNIAAMLLKMMKEEEADGNQK